MNTNRTLIIAEAGVNHNGDLALAKQLIDAAAAAGADYVKFQTFKTEKLVSPQALKAAYQKKNFDEAGDTQFQMLKKLELDRAAHEILMAYAVEKNIAFLSTAFDPESADLLYALGLRLFKIPSGEITNLPLLEKVATLAEKIILSTGMTTMGEIKAALEALLAIGFPLEKITVLHCNTQYPTPMEDVNLLAMHTIAQTYNVSIGYSDHTLGIEVPLAAVALGAAVIEKHFTVDRTLPGPDHKASLEPAELKAMVSGIRNLEKALGSGVKEPSPSEKPNLDVARKSIHLIVSKAKSEVLQNSDLIMLRPGNGISPMDYKKLIGKKLNQFLPAGHQLRWTDLEP